MLVDGEIGPTKLDVQMLDWVRANDLPFTVVATKHDKVKSSQRDRRKRDLADGCGLRAGRRRVGQRDRPASASTGCATSIREWLAALMASVVANG